MNSSIQSFNTAVSGPTSVLDSVTNAIDPIVSAIEGKSEHDPVCAAIRLTHLVQSAMF